jgi:hypothetical protein
VHLCFQRTAESRRKAAYAAAGYTEMLYFDVDFETSRGDGYWRQGIRYNFNWMRTDHVKAYLKKLESDFGSSEYLPGGLRIVKAVHDPKGIIPGLQAEIAEYSDERGRFRIKQKLEALHFSLYSLGWLEKAAFRKDRYLFLKYKQSALELLFQILYALNKEWLSDEKGLAKRILRFRYTPDQFEKRVYSIIMHHNQDAELKHCLLSLKELFADTVLLAQQRYPDLELPRDWK